VAAEDTGTPTPEETKAYKDVFGNAPPDPASTRLIGLEQNAAAGRKAGAWANDQFDALAGAWIPTNMDENQWSATVDAVQAWAQNTDYRAIPSWNHIVDMYEWATQNGISMKDSRQVAGYLSQFLPQDKKQLMPWAATGVDQGTFNQQVQNYKDFIESYMGPLASAGIDMHTLNQGMSDALAKGRSMQELQDEFTSNPDVLKNYGWVKYGMTYNQFQKTKNDPNQQAQVVARFGSGAINSDEAYLKNMAAAPPAAASGGRVQAQSARVQATAQGMSDIR